MLHFMRRDAHRLTPGPKKLHARNVAQVLGATVSFVLASREGIQVFNLQLGD